jgi:hypothetical protein
LQGSELSFTFYSFHAVSICRKSTSAPLVSADPAPVSNPFANPFGNPFANQSAPQPSAATNPFASISFSSGSSVSAGFDNSKKIADSNTSAPVSKEATVVSIGSKTANETEYQKKMKKLNESFLSWSERQINEKATAIWKDGVDVRISVF